MFCPNCGKEIEDGVKFCGECGAAIEASAAEAVSSSEVLNSEPASREETELTFKKKRFSNWTMTVNEIVTVVRSDGVNLTIEESNTKYTGGDNNKKWAFPISKVPRVRRKYKAGRENLPLLRCRNRSAGRSQSYRRVEIFSCRGGQRRQLRGVSADGKNNRNRCDSRGGYYYRSERPLLTQRFNRRII